MEAIEQASSDDAINGLRQLLRDKVPQVSAKTSLRELIEAAYDEIIEAATLNYTEDPNGQTYCNAWWCFADITGQNGFQYDIFFAEANQVGYKRTTRHPAGIAQPNDLFATDDAGEIVIDTDSPKTILDALKKADVFAN